MPKASKHEVNEGRNGSARGTVADPHRKARNNGRNQKDISAVLNNDQLHEPPVNYGSATPRINHVRNRKPAWAAELYAVPVADKITIIKKGISKKELETVKEESDLDYDTLSNILSVSKAKLHSKKGADKFDQNTSERIMLLADVVAYGQSVFEDKDSFNEWLKTTNKAFGDKAPVELMDTIYGIDEVKKEIGRIEYGVF
jgi:putative toxin-antitoxin system antitoxin component (TIGR02293 family)